MKYSTDKIKENDIKIEFSMQKILDYVQYAYDNYKQLANGDVHYLADDVFIVRLGDCLKVGLCDIKSAFAYIDNPQTKSSNCTIFQNPYRFENGELIYELIKTKFAGKFIETEKIREDIEISSDIIFNIMLDSTKNYPFTYEETVRIAEMSKTISFQIQLKNISIKRDFT